jgi:hypothetical protein
MLPRLASEEQTTSRTEPKREHEVANTTPKAAKTTPRSPWGSAEWQGDTATNRRIEPFRGGRYGIRWPRRSRREQPRPALTPWQLLGQQRLGGDVQRSPRRRRCTAANLLGLRTDVASGRTGASLRRRPTTRKIYKIHLILLDGLPVWR